MADNQRIEQQVLSRYSIIKKLGSGAYGHVWKVAANDQTSDIFALKKVFEAFQHATDAQRTFREISILKKIDHPNIIKLFEVLPSSSRDIYLVFEHMSTDLYHAIYQGGLQQIHKKYIIYQLLLGLHYLHSTKLIHRDLKPSNLLLSQQCHLKICDFGLVRYRESDRSEGVVLTEGVATRWYRAPEIILGSQNYDQKVDLWSVGCILAEMINKNPLFNCNSTMAHIQKIINVSGRPSSEEIQEMGCDGAQSIIKQCSARQKPAKEIFGNIVEEKCLDLLANLLKFNSNKRFSALQALKHPYLREFYRQSDIKQYKGIFELETDDNTQLSTQEYKQLILKYFVQKKEPQRFSDLRKGGNSTGKISQVSSRKVSGQKELKEERRNVHLFQQILREKQNSLNNARKKDRSNHRGKQNIMMNKENSILNKENMMFNNALHSQKDSKNVKDNRDFDKFSNYLTKNNGGTFAALRKVTTNKLLK